MFFLFGIQPVHVKTSEGARRCGRWGGHDNGKEELSGDTQPCDYFLYPSEQPHTKLSQQSRSPMRMRLTVLRWSDARLATPRRGFPGSMEGMWANLLKPRESHVYTSLTTSIIQVGRFRSNQLVAWWRKPSSQTSRPSG